MNKSFKDAVDSRLSSITAPADLAARVKSRAHSHVKRKSVPFRRMVAVAATFCFVIVLSIGVTAANLPQLTNLFAIVGERVQNIAQPIVQTSESSGIKMEVLAAVYTDNDAIIYLTLQDLVSSRISEDINFYDFEVSGIIHPYAEVISFDAAANMATVKITGMSREPLDGKKLTVSLKTLLSYGVQNEAVDTGLSLNSIAVTNTTPQLYYPKDINESSSNFDPMLLSDSESKSINQDKMAFVKPDTTKLPLAGAPWTYISGYGIIENAVHLQQNPNDDAGRYSNVDFVLADESMNVLHDLKTTTVGFGTRKQQGINDYSDYYETAILLPENAVENNYKILMYTRTYKYRIDGEWSTTFLLESAAETKTANCIINMNPWEIIEATVSPIGVTLKGRGQIYEYSTSAEISVNRIDGTVIQTCSSSIMCEFGPDGEDKITLQEQFVLPVDIKEIASISINGINIALK